MMAPPLQAIVLAASSMLLLLRSSAQLLSEPPSSPTTTAVASAPLKPSSPDSLLYSMQFRVGSTDVSGVIDTGSDLIWTNNSQLFDSLVSCPLDAAGKDMGMTCCNGLSTFERRYGADKYVRGVMGEAKLTFAELGDESSAYTTPDLYIGSAVLPNCHLSSVTSTTPPPTKACRAYQRGGIVGLGRGKLSLVTQLKLHSFSYCLPDHSSGSEATGQIKFNVSLKDAQTTKLATIPASSKYYLKLEKLSIKDTKTEVELSKDCPKMESNSGNGGLDTYMIIDSGSTFTTLPKNAFEAIKTYVEKQINQERETGHCYDGPYPIPGRLRSILLHFCDGVRMEIPAENYLYQDETAENGRPRFCLAIKNLTRADGKHGKHDVPILGVYQQRGMHMLFDIKENKLSFAKTSACAPSEEDHATM